MKEEELTLADIWELRMRREWEQARGYSHVGKPNDFSTNQLASCLDLSGFAKSTPFNAS